MESSTSVHPADELLRTLYRELVLPRAIEEKMLILLRQGRISKWFSGIGQEAISVGAALAVEPDEFLLSAHRNLPVFTARKLPLEPLLAQLAGKGTGFTNGRDRSFHFGALEHHIVGMISHMAAHLSLADGIGLAHRLSKAEKVVIAFCGDGATSEGEFHEALNLAAVWRLPVIFLIENNGWALSTPVAEQYACKRLADRAVGYGMEGLTIDGNDVLAVYRTVRDLAASLRKDPRPVLIECETFRVRGHEEASGIKYVPPELIEKWKARDPVCLLEQKLDERGVFTPEERARLKADAAEEVNQAVERALSLSDPEADAGRELSAVFRPRPPVTPPQAGTTERRYIDALSDGLKEALERHPNLVLMGQDIADYGGAFKVTNGLVQQFGPERIRNTPLCESAVVGAALGLSLAGYKSIVEMQFSDFATCCFNQIVNNLAKTNYRWGGKADTVIRMPCGAGLRAGPFHSQTNEAWYLSTPGLVVLYPATPADAKGLLLAAVAEDNPVIFFEHKFLYRRIKEQVPVGYYTVPIGEARIARSGAAATVVTYGLGVHWALEAQAADPGLDLEIIDLRSLCPLDFETIAASVEKTRRVLVLQEASLTCGFGAELAALISERCFSSLDAPVLRLGSLDTPIPFAAELEDSYLANSRLKEALEKLMSY